MKKFLITLTIFGGIVGGIIFVKKQFKKNNDAETDTDDLDEVMAQTGI